MSLPERLSVIRIFESMTFKIPKVLFLTTFGFNMTLTFDLKI